MWSWCFVVVDLCAVTRSQSEKQNTELATTSDNISIPHEINSNENVESDSEPDSWLKTYSLQDLADKQQNDAVIGKLRDLFWRLRFIDTEIAELPDKIAQLEKDVEDKKEFISRMKNRIKPGMTTDQILSSFPSPERDVEGDAYLDWDCEGCSKT